MIMNKRYKSVTSMVSHISKTEGFKKLFKEQLYRKELIAKIEKEIEEYIMPVNYSLECKGCRMGLAQRIYELIEKEIKKHGK